MRPVTQWALGALLLGSVGLGALLLVIEGNRASPVSVTAPTAARSSTSVRDATGKLFPVRDYRRIVSCSSVADTVLPDLVPASRIVGVSRWYAETNPSAARVADKPRIAGVQELEKIIALKPDLVIASNYSGDAGMLERLREQQIPVFELGPMVGKASFEKNLRDLSTLVGQVELGERLAQQFHRRMQQVAAHVPLASRKRGIYLNLYDTQLHGGTLGSSYYDVLTAGGLIDVAATGKTPSGLDSSAWPRFRVDDILVMNPEVIVTVRGKGRLICAMPGLETLTPCSKPGQIVEVDEGQLNDPGLGMLGTAELICDQVYPR
jgi:ABC-type hemin transport system substrate-binding protein